MVRKPDATRQPAPQDIQLMSKHRVLSFKPHLRLEWRGQDGESETEQPDHAASLGDSITSSTRIRFSVHTADFSSGSTDRTHSFTPDPRWASPSLRPGLSFRYTVRRRRTGLGQRDQWRCIRNEKAGALSDNHRVVPPSREMITATVLAWCDARPPRADPGLLARRLRPADAADGRKSGSDRCGTRSDPRLHRSAETEGKASEANEGRRYPHDRRPFGRRPCFFSALQKIKKSYDEPV
jgi:hypothetical protein